VRTFLFVMQIIAITLLVMESGYIYYKWKTRIQGYLLAICLSTLVNSMGYLFAIYGSDLGEYLIGLRMSYLGRVFVPFSLLLFVNALCNRKNNKPLMIALASIHMSIFVIVATCNMHNLYYKNMYLNTAGVYPCLGKENGIIHVLYNYLIIAYIIYGLTILIKTTLKEKNPTQKKRLLLVLAAIVGESGFYLVEILDLTVGFDDTVLGYAISSIFMFIAIFKYSLLDTLQIASDYVIDEVSEGIVIVNLNDEIEYYNKPAKSIFPFIMNYSPQILDSIRKSISSQTPLEIEGRIYTPEERALEKDGSPVGTVYVLVDDTDKYQYMDQLKEQKELAEAANASKSAFLSVVSHEIRTPMNAVVGMTELLLREGDQFSDKQRKYLNNIRTSGSSLVMIVNDILDQSKIEAGKMEIIEEPYELRAMTEDVKMIIQERIGGKPIRLLCEIGEDVPANLVGDSLRIRQILINLMNNAVKFTEEGYISLSIKCMEKKDEKMLLRFSIKDSGQGIKKEDLSKLGQAFSQVDTKKNHGKEGTGLGLSISSDFIGLMGGQLEVASEYGKGSEFFFSVYQGVNKENGTGEEGGQLQQAWKEDVDFEAPGVHALVVDDNEVNLLIMKECMSLIKITTDKALSGEEAIELAHQNTYDLIFMDYMMPGMDGVEATEKIRALAVEAEEKGDSERAQYYRSVPIIALTGDSSNETRELFMKAGIDDFTDKPVDLKKLKKKVLSWLPSEKITVD